MSLPPFPSQDLAKLVLGYLAEEQLMTAYDEFLQASPYLDALRNEYDRIFMTSLKNILAEYRAVKIYVETCKPLVLRRKLVQCTNLLDVVKLLGSLVDISKIQAQDISNDKISLSKTTSILKPEACEVCNSLNLTNCACKSKQKLNVHTASHVETSSLESSVETTALEDLPGNHGAGRKKYIRALEKESLLESNLALNESTKQSSNSLSNSGSGLNTLNVNPHSSQMKPNDNSIHCLGAIVKVTDTPECREKIEEFNSILHKVCNNQSKVDKRLYCIPEPENVTKSISNASSFQDFASGVCGRENLNVPVPDSSTSENSIAQTSIAKETNRDVSNNLHDVKGFSDDSENQIYNSYPYPRLKPRGIKDQKIKIISDIKVDKSFAKLNNATSTPLMQTIVINGTSAYKQKLPVVSNNYTKDEIMAMPTIIVVPASGPPPTMTQSKPVLAQKFHQENTKTVSSAKLLSPLEVDVSLNNAAANRSDAIQPNLNMNEEKAVLDTGLIKTVNVTKNASVPKDNVIASSVQNNTPQVLPPVRKSSSTPRRNSHIRVLDFTTPRRLLHETINEGGSDETDDKPVEAVISRSPNLVFSDIVNGENIDMSHVEVHKIETCHISKIKRESDSKPQILSNKSKIINWDADLRAVAIPNEKDDQSNKPRPKPRSRKPKKQAVETKEEKDTDKTQEKKSRSKRKTSPKPRQSKKQKKLEEEEKQYEALATNVVSKPLVKPIFNILPANNYIQQEDKKCNESNQNKSNLSTNDTPESERLCLQNEIGVRLNISEFLETPYKQVLYDIQMETPKFLGSVLPDEPISDIKIMSIPTPRFFDTPKPAQATPSSYSSRPTDYSSGGSYYKPDEQDYLRIPDIECPVTSSKEELSIEAPKEIESVNKKNSRPVRKCTKNVSYVNNSVIKTKDKGIDGKAEMGSTCSDSTSINSSFEHKEVNLKTPKENKPKIHSRSEPKKKLESIKKRKSPMKKDKSNSFMKIKPRRLTPTKENKRTRRKTDVYAQNSKAITKKKANGKENNIHITPVTGPVPTKSRRKSSTPRKLHCTKTFNSESSGHESPDINVSSGYKHNIIHAQNLVSSHDSDTEQLALRWSDDGSQDAKQKEGDAEDISKIQEYIESSVNSKNNYRDNTGNLHGDLVKRGFDIETAKSIERDLLDSTPDGIERSYQTHVVITESIKDESPLDKSVETDTSVANDLQIAQDAESDDEVELSVYECNEDNDNYIMCSSDSRNVSKEMPSKLREKFSMEVCIDDGVAIRLRATNFNMLFDNNPQNEEEISYSIRETEVAVSSISNIEKLYTPLKDHKTQCYEIFDSTLTSLDTPLKFNSPRCIEEEVTEIEIVLEEEKLDNMDIKKRRRLQTNDSLDEASNENKKTKPEAYLLQSSNIKNMDIESVLTKLHGP